MSKLDKDLDGIDFELDPFKEELLKLVKLIDEGKVRDGIIGYRHIEEGDKEIRTIIPAGLGFEAGLWIALQMVNGILNGDEVEND